MTSPALLTDHYELTMVQAALADGTNDTRCTFEVFGRSLGGGRRFGVVAGLGRLLELIPQFTYDDDTVTWLVAAGVVDEATGEWLRSYAFAGDIDGYAEGEVYFPNSPVLTVTGGFAECVVLETLVLSVLNHDTAIATAATRITNAAGDRPCIEMGGRRTHEQAAVAAARAAYIGGFAATSNLAAGRRFGIPTTGTAAHAFTLVHRDERLAFASQLASLGSQTTLLVDTYDVEKAIVTAVELAGPDLGAIRIDSGDLAGLAHRVRAQLDALGATRTRIIVSGDLDEYGLSALASAPVDGYGVGTSVVVGSGVPTAGFVYKLVAAKDVEDEDWRPVSKRSPSKATSGGRKVATRTYDSDGRARTETITVEGVELPPGRALQRPWIRGGIVVADLTGAVEDARQRRADSVAELPDEATKLSNGEPVIETVIEGASTP